MNRWHSFWQYVGECLRLLYWAFFKPFTFNHWLQQEVHPYLELNRNPFVYRREFAYNQPLQRYADQVLWLTLVTPWFIMLMMGGVYTLSSDEAFLWSRSMLLLCGWNLGMLLTNVVFKKSQARGWLFIFCFVSASVLLILVSVLGFSLKFLPPLTIKQQWVDFFIYLNESVATLLVLGVVSGVLGVMIGILESSLPINVFVGAMCVAIGVTGDVAIGVAGGIAFGAMLGVAFGAILVTVVDVAFAAVVSGVILGVMISVADGMILASIVEGVVSGVAFTVTYLLGYSRLYLWFFEALWMLILRLRYTPAQADQALRWLPSRFDEVIYLPLPFITKLVTEAYRLNNFAARQSLDHLVNFTNQQALAGEITLNIAVETLQSCQTEFDIAHLVSNKLDWITEPPPEFLGTLLPKCLDISRNVHSAFNATNAYRHKELLAKPIKELTQLRQQLAFEKNTLIRTHLGQITQRWLAILETAQNVLLEQIKQSGELPAGAYVAGNALDPELADANFRGRLVIFAEIENLMLATQPPILLLYGGRRTGKTSALKQLPKRMGTDFVPLLVDMQGVAEASTPRGVAEGIAKQMQESARSSRNMTLPDYDIEALQRDPFHALRDWFKAIEKKFPNKRFLLCMDEFERLEEVVTATQSRAPLNFLRSTYQHHNRWLILFSGSHHPDELAPYWSDYLISTRTLSVSYLQEDEARDLIEHPNNDFPVQVYNSLAIEEIIRQTHCQPYLVQLLCQNVIELINQDKRRQVVKDDVIAAMPRAIERGQQYFAELWNETLKKSSDRSIIKKLLSGEALSEEEKQRVPYLLDKNILEVSGSTYRFQVPIVEAFLRGKAQAY